MHLDDESLALLQDSAREWFVSTCPVTEFRARRDRDGRVRGNDLWPAMAELGWAGLLVPESSGGSELGMCEMGVVLEQAGRNLASGHLLSTAVIGAMALRLAEPNDFTKSTLAALAEGEQTVALAVDEGNHHCPETSACRAVRKEGGWLLNGRKTAVADVTANAYLVSAVTEDGHKPGLFWVPASAVAVSELEYIDCGDHGEIALTDVEVEEGALLVSAKAGDSLHDQVLDIARIGLAMEMLGSAYMAFEMTLDYLKIREQFGQLIGSFQALQHRAASLYVELEVCRSVVEAALIAVDNDSPEVSTLASKAKALVGDMLQHVTNEAIQLHGGIGMTDEHDAGLFLKRARVTEQLYGSAAYHRDRFARLRGF